MMLQILAPALLVLAGAAPSLAQAATSTELPGAPGHPTSGTIAGSSLGIQTVVTSNSIPVSGEASGSTSVATLTLTSTAVVTSLSTTVVTSAASSGAASSGASTAASDTNSHSGSASNTASASKSTGAAVGTYHAPGDVTPMLLAMVFSGISITAGFAWTLL